MEIDTLQHGDWMVVKLHASRFDASNAPHFKQHISDLVSQGHRKLIFDLNAVDFMDSSGLGALVSGLKRLDGRGEIKLCCLQEQILQLLELTRMTTVFELLSSLPDGE